MAYLANDPNKEADQNQVGMNVVNPTEGGQQQAAPQEGSQPDSGGGSGAGGIVQANDAQGSQAPTQAPSKRNSQGGKGSSGMFTNIRKYIDANKPQAKKMASAAGKDSQKAADTVSQKVGQKQNQLKAQLDKNKSDRDQASTFAQDQIKAATSSGAVDKANVDRFRNLATGKESFGDVQEMNLAKEQVAAKRLEQQGKTAGTEAGRRDLLKSTFGKGGREYNRGQQGLDALIVGGDADARKQLVDQTQGAAQAAQQGIKDAQTFQGRSIQEQDQANKNFAQGLQDQTTGAADKFVADADAAMKAAQEMRAQQAAQLDETQAGLKSRMDALRSQLDMGDKANREKLMRDLQYFKDDKEYNADMAGSQFSKNEAAQRFIETGDRSHLTGLKHRMGGQDLDQYLRNSVLGKLSENAKDLELLGIDPNIYSGSFDSSYNPNRANDLITGNKGRKWLDSYRVFDEIQGLNQKLGSFNTDELLQKQLGEIQGGLSLDQFRQGADISRESVSSPEDIAKYQALSQLAGGTGSDMIAENRGDYLDQQKFADYMAKLGKL